MSEVRAQKLKVLFAYPGKPNLRAETMRDTAKRIGEGGDDAQTWEKLAVEGRVLVDTICEAIDKADLVIAEVSDLNSNVLFEAGFALARNKHLWLILDETDDEANRHWKEIGILSTVGRVDYSGSSDRLVRIWRDRRNELSGLPRLMDSLMSGGKARQADAVFAPGSPAKFQAAVSLERTLGRRSDLTILGAADDFGIAPLDFYVKEIYRSSAAIFHLMAPKRVRSTEHNARASLLAGVARGLDLPTLMVVEEGFQSPLDYKDLLFSYDSAAVLQERVERWLEELPKNPGSNKRLGRLALDIELPLRSFGQYVAEYEREELTNYFVNTSEFQSIMAGDAKVFVGRKGTGKTATMSQAVLDLRKDRRNLVVPIKPSAYELAGFVEFVEALDSESQSEYVMLNLWVYLLYTEVAVRAVSYASERPAGTGTNSALLELVSELNDLAVNPDDDLSVRLEQAVATLANEPRRDGESTHAFVGRVLGLHRLPRLKELILQTLKDFDRVAVLIDNLDKTWEKGIDYRVMAKFILSLLSAIGRVEKDFARPPSGLKPVKITLTVFLRTDIYDAVARFAREPDKVGVLSVRWHDAELLLRVLEERYAANRSKRSGAKKFDMWEEVFEPEVRGIPTRDYFLWRALPRPRDFIYLANAALKTAINRKHSIIKASDIIFAEQEYSRFAIEALLVESDAEDFDLEEILYEFAGLSSTLSAEELDTALTGNGDVFAVRDWLIRTSFLGIEVSEGEFKHVEGSEDAKRQLRVATRTAKKLTHPLGYRVHPAFRMYLDVRDDDLHDGAIHDATFDKTGVV